MIHGLSSELERILAAGNSAPSGENCQPWRFVVRPGLSEIEIHLLPERDQSPYSWGQRASYLANGAAIENMAIAASSEGYRTEVRYFPREEDEWHVATLALAKDPTIKPDALASFIGTRVSNRKVYEKKPLAREERAAFLDAAANGYGEFALTEAPADVERLGRVGSTNEEVMLANHLLHSFFFSHVNWTEAEDREKKVGFYIKTLELPPPAEAMFKLFRHWTIMRIFNALGFNRLVAKQNAAVNAAASAMGALMLAETDPLDFVKAGRTIERLWLTATALGLSLQPLTGILFFKLKLDAGEHAVFSPVQQKRISDAYQDVARIFSADGKHIAFMVRLGRGAAPSAQAIRFPLAEVVDIPSK
ncbi:hypothetical protein HYV30_01200 [Candidatus Kaiserbacteria bacterium]|nr:hypothetical protein [Candidatus Kaiserbacteria bacterium]